MTAGPRARGVVLVAGAALVALAAPGCGDDDGGSAGGPAGVVPAEAPLYAESVIRPEGEERETIERVIADAAGEDDPGAYVVEQLNEAAAEEDSDFTYEQDIEPWLGERAAVFFADADALLDEEASSAAQEGCIPPDSTIDPSESLGEELGETCVAEEDDLNNAVLVIETTDAEAARAAVEKAADEESDDPPEEASYEGVEYRVDSDGMAAGVVEGFVVAGAEDGLKAAIDVSGGEPAIAESEELATTLADVGESPTASLYLDTPELIEAAERRGELDAQTRAGLDLSFGQVTEGPVALAADVGSEGIAVTSSTGAARGDAGIAQSALLDEVPAEAWLAVGASDLGERVSEYLEALADAAPGQFDLDRIRDEFRRQSGFELEDLYRPLGDLSIFVTGASPLELRGAVLVETSDPDASADLLESLAERASQEGEQVSPLDVSGLEDATGFSIQPPGAPAEIHVFQMDDRVIAVYGDDAAAEIADPSGAEALVDSDSFTAAKEALGEGFELGTYLDTETVAELVASIPASSGEVTPEQVADGIDAFDFLVAGVRTEGDRRIGRLLLGLDG